MIETKLKQVLSRRDVDDSMKKMASLIHDIDEPIALIAILKGGAYVTYRILDLMHQIDDRMDIVIGHIGLESYGDGTKSCGEVKLMTPLDISRNVLRNRNIVILDDCVETGKTIKEAKKIIYPYNPLTISTAVLVDKITLRAQAGVHEPDIVGWKYEGEGFLVGCGMGAGEKFRGFPGIYEVILEG